VQPSDTAALGASRKWYLLWAAKAISPLLGPAKPEGTGFRGVSVERGVGGAQPSSPPAFLAICHFLFDSMQDFVAAFLPHAERLQGDIANYTDIEPVIQFNEVLISR